MKSANNKEIAEPVPGEVRQPLLGLTLKGLKDLCAREGLPGFAAKQIARRLYVNRVRTIDEMTELSKTAREKLNPKYTVGLYGPSSEMKSADGTAKYLFRVPVRRPCCGNSNKDGFVRGVADKVPDCNDRGGVIESVYIPDRDRATVCVSSQIGCRMNCSFCFTGRNGFHGNLTATDIMNQIFSIPGSENLTNIVFMGMGEPCDNLQPVLDVLEILTSDWGLGWSPKRITVSSVGKLEDMRRLVESTRVHIALSVHSPFAEEREELMPVEKVWPVKKVVEMLRDFDFAHQRRLSVEYIMWRGLNDGPRHADALARLLRGTSARVNLISYHAAPDDPRQRALPQVMEAFRDRLNDLGVTATIRASRGEDIMAACGMLAGKDNTAKP